MMKRRIIVFLVLLLASFSIYANSSEDNPRDLIKITKKTDPYTVIKNGEFYRFDFNAYKDRYAWVEVLSKNGSRISMYQVGYKKKAYSDVLYISQNAAKVNVYFSETEDSVDKLAVSFKITPSTYEDSPYSIYPGNILAGQNNSFNFSGFKRQYAIVQCLDEIGREITFIAQKRKENGQNQEFFIPAKTKKVRISTSNDETSFFTPVEVVNVQPSENPVTIKSFMAASFRNLDLSIYQRKTKEEYGVIEYLDSKYNVIYADTVKNAGEAGFNGKVYIPKDALYANIAFSNNEMSFSQAFDFIDILQTTSNSALKIPDSYYEGTRFKTTEINPVINEFITYLNINLFKTHKKMDTLFDFITEKIDLITTNDYEKVKLYHDATVALLTYNEYGEVKDYKDAVGRGAVNSQGFALVFKEFCRRGNIPCLVIHGNAKKFDHGATGWNPKDGIKLNQYWNIFVIDNKAFLADVSLDSKESRGSSFYSCAWLYVRPDEFIYSHYPCNSEFQLLDKTVTPERYLKMQFTKTGIVTEEEVRKLEEQKAAKLEAEKEAKEKAALLQAALAAEEQEEEAIATGKKKKKKKAKKDEEVENAEEPAVETEATDKKSKKEKKEKKSKKKKGEAEETDAE